MCRSEGGKKKLILFIKIISHCTFFLEFMIMLSWPNSDWCPGAECQHAAGNNNGIPSPTKHSLEVSSTMGVDGMISGELISPNPQQSAWPRAQRLLLCCWAARSSLLMVQAGRLETNPPAITELMLCWYGKNDCKLSGFTKQASLLSHCGRGSHLPS